MAKTKAESDPSNKGKNDKKKKTKSRLSAPAAAAMKSSKQQPKTNPFETIHSRSKFDILGKKRKGEERRVGHARSVALEKRKQTLQKEYEQNAKSSVFVDKRIGEKDETLAEFDKGILRLQRAHQVKLKKSNKYNLEDFDEDGSALHSEDDFTEDVPLDDDDEELLAGTENGLAASKFLNLHAGMDFPEANLENGLGNVHKTKKQVMSEIISKSKFYKAQKAMDKEEDDHLMAKLDEDFMALAQKEALISLTEPRKVNALTSLANKNKISQSNERGSSNSANKESLEKEKPDAYDKLVKEMSLDMRARPSDRTKTPEEIAQEERERLESLEEERRKRMLGEDDSSDSDVSGDEDHKTRSKNFQSVSGDDLGDSFTVNEEMENQGGWVDDIYEKEERSTSSGGSESDEDDQQGSGEEDDSDENETADDKLPSMPLKDWEQNDDDDLGLDIDEADDHDKEIVRENTRLENMESHKSSSTHIRHASLKNEALPYVIEAPTSIAEFCSLVDGRSEEEIIEAVNRIHKCSSTRLSENNRSKMQVFYGVLLHYFAVSAAQIPLNVKRLNNLVKPLIEISAEIPLYAGDQCQKRLEKTRAAFCEHLRNPEKNCWPSLKTLLFLRLWSVIYPCSDFRHVVMTPSVLLMCEYLMRCPIKSGRDAAVGSFLCSMLLSIAKQSKKFFPEVIPFLQTFLVSCLEPERRRQQHYQFHHLMELDTPKALLLIRDQTAEVHPVDFFKVMQMKEDSPFFLSDNFKASILSAVVEILRGFVDIYADLSSYTEIFQPIVHLLREVLQNTKLPTLLRGNINDILNLVTGKIDTHQMQRQPLQMRKQKPAPIKLLNPKFEESFVKGRDYDPDRERAELKKLKKRVKQEAKGAQRELRKDSHFMFTLKEKERIQQEEEQAEKYGKARAFLQEQEHAFKSGQLGKGRKRR